MTKMCEQRTSDVYDSDYASDTRVSEEPILDLSCKRSTPPRSPAQSSTSSLYNDSGFKESLSGAHSPQSSPERSSSVNFADNNNSASVKNHSSSYQQQQQQSAMELQHKSLLDVYHQQQQQQPNETGVSAFSVPAESLRKSPFENRAAMHTPPSEPNSPKKARYSNSPLFDHSSLQQNTNLPNTADPSQIHPSYPVFPMTMPVAMSTVLPSLLQAQPTMPTHQIQMPVPSMMTPSPMEESTKKPTRPFKAYGKEPFSFPVAPVIGTDMVYDEAYTEFRKQALDASKKFIDGTNAKMRRTSSKSPGLPINAMDDKDAAYWERRRKNNEAAKRSRDARRAKEDEIAIRAAFLEQQYLKLKCEVAALRDENARMRCMIYSR